MATPIIMPRQGQSVESCIITQWFKKKGEAVKKGDLLFSYETDKASFELESETEGILLDTFFNEGDEVPVLINVAVIGAQGESADAFKPGNSKDTPKETASQPKEETAMTSAEQVANKTTSEDFTINEGKIKISPRARNLAERLGAPINQIQGHGPEGRIIEKDVESYAQSGALLTPIAKEIAKEKGMVASGATTGIGGRARSYDMVDFKSVDTVDSEVKKLSNIRKIIAKSMFESIQSSAQLTHHMGADARKLLEARTRVKAAMEQGRKDNITLNDMVCYCVIKALKKFPEANSHFLGDSIRTFNKVHLGLAVDTPRGLMVPTIRNADDLSIQGLSSQLKNVAEACKKGSIDPELLASTAGSFTVSNLGNYGVEIFTPIINLPQVAILGVNTIVPRPADLGNGVFGFVPYIGLSLTYDHRAIDGGPATLFLREIKTEIEKFTLLL
jgi:pyruvate dehydrogenase E2 component (dihydrolipoamide acetyltransferase)